jgi:hypothetical protein
MPLLLFIHYPLNNHQLTHTKSCSQAQPTTQHQFRFNTTVTCSPCKGISISRGFALRLFTAALLSAKYERLGGVKEGDVVGMKHDAHERSLDQM